MLSQDVPSPSTILDGVDAAALSAELKALPAKPQTSVFFVLHAAMLLIGEEDTQYPAARAVLGSADGLAKMQQVVHPEAAGHDQLQIKGRSFHGIDALVKHPSVWGQSGAREMAKHGGPQLMLLRTWVLSVYSVHVAPVVALRKRGTNTQK